MTAPHWQSLRVIVNDRAAIYAEAFPGQLAAVGARAVEWDARGAVTGLDWRLPQLHDAYGDRWAPPLLARIRRLG